MATMGQERLQVTIAALELQIQQLEDGKNMAVGQLKVPDYKATVAKHINLLQYVP